MTTEALVGSERAVIQLGYEIITMRVTPASIEPRPMRRKSMMPHNSTQNPARAMSASGSRLVAETYTTTYTTPGYVVAIISILGFCIMPRVKFIQTVTFNITSICISAVISLLMLWSGVQGWLHTTPVPQFTFPTILYAIFVNVAATFGSEFMTTTQAESFIQHLLQASLAALESQQANESKKPTKKPEVEALKIITTTITKPHGILHWALLFTKREIAYGKLSLDDLEKIFKNLRPTLTPLADLRALVDIFGRSAGINGWDVDKDSNYPNSESKALHKKAVNDWNEIMKTVHEPFATIIQAMDQGLEHVLFKLKWAKPLKNRMAPSVTDPETEGDHGRIFQHPNTSHYFQEEEEEEEEQNRSHQRNQKQLHLLPYMEFLLYPIICAVLDFVRFVDKLGEDHQPSRLRFIVPRKRRFKKWISNSCKAQDANHDDTTAIGGTDGNNTIIYMGEAYRFRCACATMSIAIVAYLRDTLRFFIEQRMTPTAGQSVFAFLLKITGTMIAMVFVALGYYTPVKHPKFVVVGIISVVTATAIVSYELEVRKIGRAAPKSNSQPYYAIYLLGPYRLATVTVMAQIRGDEGDPVNATTPGWKLAEVRSRVFAKQMRLLQALNSHSNFVKWKFPLAEKFPKKTTHLKLCVSHLNENETPEAQWFRGFQKFYELTNITSHEITSMLSLLSSSVTNGQLSPPYLPAPQSYQLSRRVGAVDPDSLSFRHIAEPRYGMFTVLQVMKKLVGELDCSFHIVSTQNPSETSSIDALVEISSRRSKQA
ncbi:hypothetical protein K469DRAFT_737323 [Zopfia rhizophila CBS 207.26]|uniref:Putative ER transporter 6TM N-terminal domain-containing protein n=1 Tax=Zopfia rhizophila CBS 207.26 TaxID=1314779 RepID=A0A6A6EEL3_9PEZI|nr:hypothetical protein K469DRAFT_737323 [Zopfia rhizophila CBS 207.26]